MIDPSLTRVNHHTIYRSTPTTTSNLSLLPPLHSPIIHEITNYAAGFWVRALSHHRISNITTYTAGFWVRADPISSCNLSHHRNPRDLAPPTINYEIVYLCVFYFCVVHFVHSPFCLTSLYMFVHTLVSHAPPIIFFCLTNIGKIPRDGDFVSNSFSPL